MHKEPGWKIPVHKPYLMGVLEEEIATIVHVLRHKALDEGLQHTPCVEVAGCQWKKNGTIKQKGGERW